MKPQHLKHILMGMAVGVGSLFASLAESKAQTYCTPTVGTPNSATANYGIGVGQLSFGNITHGTNTLPDYLGGYIDYYNTISDTISRGQTRSISITSGTVNINVMNVWIDMDNDGIFSSGEVFYSASSYTGTTTGNIAIPSGTTPGPRRMRIGVEFGAYGSVNPCGPNAYGQFKDFQIVILNNTSGVDIGTFSIMNPVVFGPGNNTLQTSIYNVASDSIGSADVGFLLSGSSAVTTSLSGTSFNGGKYLQPGKRLNYTFGTPVAPVSGYYTLKVWSRNPNSTSPDLIAANDTLTKVFCVGLKGTYTIGTGGDYASFNDAVDALQNCGVAGAVVFNVKPGTYNEQVEIGPIVGAFGSNTVTFSGGTDTTQVKLVYNGSATGDAHTLQLTSTKRIIFRNMQIHGLNGSYAFAVNLNNGADSNEFRNCLIYVPNVANTNVIAVSTNDGTYYYNSSTSSYNRWDSCFIKGGYFAACIYGNNANGNNFYNNTIESYYYYGLYSINNYFGEVIGNTVNTPSSAGYGIYTSGTNALIKGNRVGLNGTLATYGMSINNNRFGKVEDNISYGTSYGIRAYDGTAAASGTNNTLINNIGYASGAGTTYGIYIYCSNGSIYHNSASGGYYGLFLAGGSGNNVVNNIFESRGVSGYPYYQASSAYTNKIDYNIYWGNSTMGIAYVGSAFGNIANLKSAYPTWNQNSEVINPNFVGSGDYHISSVVAPKYGDNTLNILTDVDGNARCLAAPTVGADESGFVVNTPAPAVSIGDTVWINSPTRIYPNTPKKGPFGYEWDFGVDGVVDDVNHGVNWTFNNYGLDSFKLKIIGCFGTDSIIKYVWVDTPNVAPKADFIADKNVITPADVVYLTDLSENGAVDYKWTANPGFGVVFYPSDDSQDPEVSFSNPGVYEICLEVTNARGTDKICKSKYISVAATGYLCQFPFNTQAPDGFLYDEGGPNANYSGAYAYPYLKNKCNYLIDPCASSVTISFSAFSLSTLDYGLGTDSLKIYNGPDNKSPLLGAYIGSSLPPTLTANSGKMYIEFIKHSYGYTAPGFVAKWSSVPATFPKPNPSIFSDDTLYTGVPFRMVARGADKDNVFYWDFDSDGYDDEIDITDTVIESFYTYPLPGAYTAQLVTTGCGGIDTTTKLVIVIDPPSTPLVDFEAELTRVEVGMPVKFTDKTQYGPILWDWATYPATSTMNTSVSQNPEITFNAAGPYTVRLTAENYLGQDSLVKASYITAYDYCAPSVSNLHPDIGISKVSLDGNSNSSSQGQVSYTYFNSLLGALEKGTTHTITVERTTTLNDMTRKVWVDWNRDGAFDNSELILNEPPSKTLSYTDTFTVPTTITNGPSRMRVAVNFGTLSNTACGTNQYGEYEDYRVLLADDVTKPVITLNWMDTVDSEIGYVYVDSGATAFDNIDGVITSSIVTTNLVNNMVEGSYTVTYNVTDSRGNMADPKHRTVRITEDKTAPAIFLFGGDTTVQVGDVYADPGAYAIDLVDGNVTGSISVVNPVTTALVDTFFITYTAQDSKGNMTGLVTRRVIVADLIAPVITLNGALVDTVEVNTPWTDPGATVTDNYYSGLVYTRTPFNTNTLGTFVLDYDVVDGYGNAAVTQSRTVVVLDRTAPVITFNGTDTIIIDVFTTYNDPGETVTDNYDTGLSAVVTGTINTSALGDYNVDYEATDGSGNTTIKRRVIRVVDREAPVMVLRDKALVIWPRWKPYTDTGVVITDNYYTALVPDTITNVDVNAVGMYYVTYSLIDPSGNIAADVTRIVYIQELANGIADAELRNSVQIYPNPTSGIVNIQWEGQTGNITVIDAFGKVVKEITAVDPGATVDLSELAAGNYLVRLQTGDVQVVKSLNLVK